jgi:hypothetical protein
MLRHVCAAGDCVIIQIWALRLSASIGMSHGPVCMPICAYFGSQCSGESVSVVGVSRDGRVLVVSCNCCGPCMVIAGVLTEF